MTRARAPAYSQITMQRPPDRRSPQIFFSNQSNEWINRISQKHKQLNELQLSAEEKAELKSWLETEFIHSLLKLENSDRSREEIARLIAAQASSAGEIKESEEVIFFFLRAFRKIEELAETKERAARLTPELLIGLNETGLRQTEGDRARSPIPAGHLRAAIESACMWYGAESFEELNPIEQAAIVLLRLAEIEPFERANLETALVAASLFTCRSQLPPVIINTERHSAFFGAFEESRRMNTRPMVELIASEIETALDRMIDRIKRQK